MKDKKKIASEYIGLDEYLIEYLQKFNDKENIWILTKYGYTRGLYETFFTREEAEKALEDLKNG